MDESKRGEIDLLAEHIASRKAWGNYVRAATEIHRTDVEEVDDFIAHLQARLNKGGANREIEPGGAKRSSARSDDEP